MKYYVSTIQNGYIPVTVPLKNVRNLDFTCCLKQPISEQSKPTPANHSKFNSKKKKQTDKTEQKQIKSRRINMYMFKG